MSKMDFSQFPVSAYTTPEPPPIVHRAICDIEKDLDKYKHVKEYLDRSTGSSIRDFDMRDFSEFSTLIIEKAKAIAAK